MKSSICYPLSPVDYVLLATHESLRRRGYCGLNVMLIAEAEGDLPFDELEAALRKLGDWYPALSANLRYSKLRRRPYWSVDSSRVRQDVVEYLPHRIEDESSAWEPLTDALNEPINLQHGPQLRVVHVQMGGGRQRLGLRWAHPFMDYEGGHRLLGALHDILCGRTPSLSREPDAVFPPPFELGAIDSLARAWQGRWLYAVYDSYRQPRIVKKPENTPKQCRFILRTYNAEQRRSFESLAKTRISPGPLRYTRVMLVALARTYLAMATERGRPREHYIFPMPLPLPRNGPRPGVHGNYVTIPWIVFSTADLNDWASADTAASRQLREYFEKRRDQATWYMYRAASRWPLGLTRLLTVHRHARAAAAMTGSQLDDSVAHLGRARITNLTGAGPPDCHPGWLLGRTTFAETMSLSITYFEDYFDTPNVKEFFNRLEVQLFGPDGSHERGDLS